MKKHSQYYLEAGKKRYHGYDYFITFSSFGYRVGNIRIPKDHPLYDKTIKSKKYILHCEYIFDSYYLQVCCNNYNHKVDLSLTEKYFGKEQAKRVAEFVDEFKDAKVVSLAECDALCKEVIDTILKGEEE